MAKHEPDHLKAARLEKENLELRIQLQSRTMWQEANEGNEFKTEPSAFSPFQNIVRDNYVMADGKLKHKLRFDDKEAVRDIFKENAFLLYKEPEVKKEQRQYDQAMLDKMSSDELWKLAETERDNQT